MEINKKIIYGIDFLIIVGSLITLIVMFGYARPLVIGPIDNYNTTNNSVLFTFEKGKAILLDDNIEFSSPQRIFVENYLVLHLEPGKYYWKIEGALPSTVRTLTINSIVDLKLRKIEGGKEEYEVVNAGNTQLDVDIYHNDNLNRTLVLDIDESKQVSGEAFVGRQNG
ncbi:hypothetical protein HYW75_04685 [Candidatus Pacearchaeota archaeon]|nr:hypothetical protein [Candidatus Pacearchaeota archaeon]